MPLWALGVAALVVGAWNVVQLPFLADYAIHQAPGQGQSPISLGVLAYFSAVISVLTIWAFLLFLFRGRYSAGRAVIFAVGLTLVAVVANGIGIPLAFAHVMGQSLREASAADKAAIQAGKRFEDPADAELVTEAITALQKITGDETIGALAVHADPAGQGRVVCGDVAFKTESRAVWAGFVARRRTPGEPLVVVSETDGFSERGRAKCRPNVIKYLGETGIDYGEAEMAFSRAGCKELDTDYWMAWKTYCTGRPVAVASSAKR